MAQQKLMELEQLKVDSELEELFYSLLVDYEISSMVKSIKTQFKLGNRRYDFALIIDDENIILIECDSRQWHSTPNAIMNDKLKDYIAEDCKMKLLRFTSNEIFLKPQYVANCIEATIDLLK